MLDQNNKQPPQTLDPEQIKRAAASGVELLNTRGAVNVPSHMALSGDIQILDIVLKALAAGSVVLGKPVPLEVVDESKESVDESKDTGTEG